MGRFHSDQDVYTIYLFTLTKSFDENKFIIVHINQAVVSYIKGKCSLAWCKENHCVAFPFTYLKRYISCAARASCCSLLLWSASVIAEPHKALSLYSLKFNWANTSAPLHPCVAVFGFSVTHASFKTQFDWQLESQFHNTLHHISCVRDGALCFIRAIIKDCIANCVPSSPKWLQCFPRGNEAIDKRPSDKKRPEKPIKYSALPQRTNM